jgi:hypothetical protein
MTALVLGPVCVCGGDSALDTVYPTDTDKASTHVSHTTMHALHQARRYARRSLELTPTQAHHRRMLVQAQGGTPSDCPLQRNMCLLLAARQGCTSTSQAGSECIRTCGRLDTAWGVGVHVIVVPAALVCLLLHYKA